MNHPSYKIDNDSRIAIVGGGPAGSFFALYLRHFARIKGLNPRITIYQDRFFDTLGPKGCKGCAGIISMSLIKNMAELNISPPPEVIQTTIDRFAVHSPYATIDISNPDTDLKIMSVYRGGGPRVSHYEKKISFDGWLLRQAENNGIEVVNERIASLWTGGSAGIEVAGKRIDYDLLGLATGVNAPRMLIEGTAYEPPETNIMAMSELYLGAADVRTRLGNVAHAFLIPHSGMIFGTLVPKGDFVNVSVLSSSKYPVTIADFLNYAVVREILPQKYELACGCRPQTSFSAASNYYADRFIAIGDAACTRLYKDGIGSSLTMARAAADAAINYGVSSRDFRQHYRPVYNKMRWNNHWGHLLFSINDQVKESKIFMLAQQRLIGDEQEKKTERQPFTKAAWGIFTGSYSYGRIAQKIFSPASLVRLFAALVKEAGENFVTKRTIDQPRKLYVGDRKVLILGSGFGGAYTLRHLVKSTNKNENVQITVVNDENYFLFTPLLHEVAMGSIETRHISYPVRRLHWRDRFNFILTTVKKIDLINRQVATEAGVLDFDCLVMALGSVPDKSQLNLAGGHVFTLKTLYDAMKLRNHIIAVFEQAAIEKDMQKQKQLLTFVAVGGGYIGIQAVSELRDCIFKNLIRYYKGINPDNIKIMLIESRPKVVERMDHELGAYVMKQLEDMGIEVRTNSRMTRAWEGHVEINEEEVIPTATIMWSTGMVSNPLIAALEAPTDNLGRVKVNTYLEVEGFPGIYALGDCAHFENPKSAQPIPPRAHTTVRQAKIVAYNIIADIRGRSKKAYRYTDSGEIVSLGDSKAVFRFYRIRLYGFAARLIWMGAYSLLIKGVFNRVRIVFDWLLALIFGRDSTFLNLKDH
ncbi:MAG: FAD-dependent oxidoreductase [Syntrophobacterales bacterium]|nr:FAD-dependent oxidoreductase [Syntrophobacterales bacterium]